MAISPDLPPAIALAERRWQDVRAGSVPDPRQVVQISADPLLDPEWDVVIAGATLGVLMGSALARQGWRVALLDQGLLRGRDQEWNISRGELEVLLRLELLTPAELERVIASEYNPGRIALHEGPEFWIRDVLNVGVDPVTLLEALKQSFLAAGGQLFEQSPLQQVSVHPNGVTVRAGDRPDPGKIHRSFRSRLLLDVMGHGSPLVRQARQGALPEAHCIVVGTCAKGYPRNEQGDLFVSTTPILEGCQPFWEAFPARDGRTTYLFTYLDGQVASPGPARLYQLYRDLLPAYQQVEWEQLSVQRTLCGVLPSYRASPLQMPWNRILAVGDSSGAQSPLSFGGFGAMLRHLERLSRGVMEALQADCLDRASLALLQPYQPNLSVTWLFQQSMSLRPGQSASAQQINRLLGNVFGVMNGLGEGTLKPFLQDVVQFPGLAKAMLMTGLIHPVQVLGLLPQLGVPALLDWSRHFAALGSYGLLGAIAQLPTATQSLTRQSYRQRRRQESWWYGAGLDYGQTPRDE
jgi:lycopene cyclase CruP